MKTLRIGHLYSKLLNIYGDGGNILTLKKRCEWRGINVIVEEINVGDSISEHDLYFILMQDRIYASHPFPCQGPSAPMRKKSHAIYETHKLYACHGWKNSYISSSY